MTLETTKKDIELKNNQIAFIYSQEIGQLGVLVPDAEADTTAGLKIRTYKNLSPIELAHKFRAAGFSGNIFVTYLDDTKKDACVYNSKFDIAVSVAVEEVDGKKTLVYRLTLMKVFEREPDPEVKKPKQEQEQEMYM